MFLWCATPSKNWINNAFRAFYLISDTIYDLPIERGVCVTVELIKINKQRKFKHRQTIVVVAGNDTSHTNECHVKKQENILHRVMEWMSNGISWTYRSQLIVFKCLPKGCWGTVDWFPWCKNKPQKHPNGNQCDDLRQPRQLRNFLNSTERPNSRNFILQRIKSFYIK